MDESHPSMDFMLSPTVIGVGLHRLGLKSNSGQVEVRSLVGLQLGRDGLD